MIDIASRRKAAEVTRRFIAGQISNRAFETAFPSSQDPAISAIEDTLWCCYDDFEEHCLKGTWSVTEQTSSIMFRCLIFLYTDEQYQWPTISYPGVRPIKYGLFGRLLNRHKKQHTFLTAGDIAYWPFINKERYDNAKKHPLLLAGYGAK